MFFSIILPSIIILAGIWILITGRGTYSFFQWSFVHRFFTGENESKLTSTTARIIGGIILILGIVWLILGFRTE